MSLFYNGCDMERTDTLITIHIYVYDIYLTYIYILLAK